MQLIHHVLLLSRHSYCCSTDSSNLTEIDVDGDGKSPQPLKYSLFQVKNVQMQAFMAANTHYAKFMDGKTRFVSLSKQIAQMNVYS